MTAAVAVARPTDLLDALKLPGDSRVLDAIAVATRLAGHGLTPDQFHTGHRGSRVWVQVLWGSAHSSAEAVRLLRAVGADQEIGPVDEPEGREWSGHTPAGVWVYVPCRQLTPYTQVIRTVA